MLSTAKQPIYQGVNMFDFKVACEKIIVDKKLPYQFVSAHGKYAKTARIVLKCLIHHNEFDVGYGHFRHHNTIAFCPECAKMTRVLDTESFIRKAKELYGDKYDYSNSVYTTSETCIEIFCNTHKISFYKTPNHFLRITRGSGCPKCSSEGYTEKQILGNEEFIRRAKLVHGDKYDYSQVDYRRNVKKVKIFCKTHNEYFFQTPHGHMRGLGCRKCGIIKLVANMKTVLTFNDFVERVNKIHEGRYTYSEETYINTKQKTTITCKIHGDFQQTPAAHMVGQGCRKCVDSVFSKGEKRIYKYLKENDITFSQQYKDSNCKYIRHLKFDFCIHVDNKIGLIEYNGSQHYRATEFFDKSGTPEDNLKVIQHKDNIKYNFCVENKIPYLVIKYTNYENVEALLEEFINSLKEANNGH
jgi:hypothetical protein